MPNDDRDDDRFRYDDSCPRCGDRYGGCPECKGPEWEPEPRWNGPACDV